MKRKAQLSVVEMGFVLLLLSTYLLYLGTLPSVPSPDPQYQIDSALDSLYYSEEYRDLFLNENLDIALPTGNWTNVTEYLNRSFSSYELIIASESQEKYIETCSASYYKSFSERILVVDTSGEEYEFRKLSLGVCA